MRLTSSCLWGLAMLCTCFGVCATAFFRGMPNLPVSRWANFCRSGCLRTSLSGSVHSDPILVLKVLKVLKVCVTVSKTAPWCCLGIL